MNVLITGAHGFIGKELCRVLLRDGVPSQGEEAARALKSLTLIDTQPGPAEQRNDPRVRSVLGDASDPRVLQRLVNADTDLIVALGATLTAEAEHDFDRGLQVNLHGMLHLLEACRKQARRPRLVYASSLAAYGGQLPDTVEDSQVLTPQTSYGTHKAVNELLINDYSRRGYVDGRALRLPIVVTRPDAQMNSISGRLGALVREPLAGRDVVCPVAADTRLPLASVQAAAEALRAVCGLPPDVFNATRAMNLPSLSVRVHELVQAVQTIPAWRGWRHPVGQVLWEHDPALQRIVDAWPHRIESSMARRLGIVGDRSLPHVINRYLNAAHDTVAATP